MSNLDAFKASFKGDVVTQSDADYEQAIKRWSLTAERRAKIVAFVKDADDVAQALKYAQSEGLKIAVRGGGHNPAGASSVEDGLVVDLSRYLGNVRVDQDAKLGYIGGGAIWETVDKEAIKYGLATVGGTVNHVGGNFTWRCIRASLIDCSISFIHPIPDWCWWVSTDAFVTHKGIY